MQDVVVAVQRDPDWYAGYVRIGTVAPAGLKLSIHQLCRRLWQRDPTALGHCLERALARGDAALARRLLAAEAPVSLAAAGLAAEAALQPAGVPLLMDVLAAYRGDDDVLGAVFDRWDHRADYARGAAAVAAAVARLRAPNPAMVDAAIQRWLDMAGEGGAAFCAAARRGGARVATAQKPPQICAVQ